jgi:hypothetical protein
MGELGGSRLPALSVGASLARKSSIASRLEPIEDVLLEVPPEEELTRPIAGPLLLVIDLPQETVPLLDLYLEYD